MWEEGENGKRKDTEEEGEVSREKGKDVKERGGRWERRKAGARVGKQ